MVPQALAAFVRSETLRLVQYLATLRALPRDGPPIQALVVAPPGERAAFEQALVSDARARVPHHRRARGARGGRAARRLPEGAAAEALYLHLAARKPPREQFASRDDRRRYFVWQLQRAVVAAGALGFAACALYAGAQLARALRAARAAPRRRRARRAAPPSTTQRITAAFPVTADHAPRTCGSTVVEFRRIAERSAVARAPRSRTCRGCSSGFPQFEIDSDQLARRPARASAAQAASRAGRSRAKPERAGRAGGADRDLAAA